TLDIYAQTYEAGVRVEDLYWYNHPLHNGTVEWVCTTKAVLYFGDEEVEPSPEHSYVWYKNPSGTWVVTGTNYFITPDGNPDQYYQVKVKITGPGFSVTSQPFTIGLSGEVQLLEVRAKLQNGSSLGNSYTYFQNYT